MLQQVFGTHWIEFVYVTDQDNNVVCAHNFTADETSARHVCGGPLPDTVTTVTSFEYVQHRNVPLGCCARQHDIRPC